MRHLICGALIIVLIFSVAVPAGAQVPFADAHLRQDAMPQILSRFSQAVLDNQDTEKIKQQLFEAFVFELVRRGELPTLAALAKRGDKLEYRDPEENSLIHVAASNGDEAMLRFLIENGLDVGADNEASRSPLFLAAQANHLATVKILLNAGANVNGNSQQSHPLNTAAWYGHLEMVNLLLEKDANINLRDSDGNSALHKAVWQGHIPIVERLIAYGSDPEAKNNAGLTPRSIVESRLMNPTLHPSIKRRWGTEQVCGPPDASFGDDPNAWASKSQDGQAEWLLVEFKDAVVPASLEVYENLAPKALVKITAVDSAGKEHESWSGKDPAVPGKNGVYVANIKLMTKFKTKKFRLHLNSVAVKNWNEIDAVRLTSANGKKQWVSKADASSCYADATNPESSSKKYETISDLLNDN